MTLEPQHAIAGIAVFSSAVLFFLGLYASRKFKRQDEIEARVRTLELQQASNYSSRDAIDAAVARAMAPLDASIRRQETRVDEMSSLVLKMLHLQGVD